MRDVVVSLSRVAIVLVLGACGSAHGDGSEALHVAPAPWSSSSSGGAAISADADAGPSAGDDAVVVTSTGSTPRRALRYVFHPGTKEILQMDMRMAVALEMDGNAAPSRVLPTSRMLGTMDAQRVTPDGNLVFRFTLDSVNLDAAAGDTVGQKAGEALRKLVGMTTDCEMTPRGRIVSVKNTVPPGADPSAADAAEQTQNTVRDVAVPLPEQPVGVGATWMAMRTLRTRHFEMKTTVAYRLTNLDGDRAAFEATVGISAPPQPMSSSSAHMRLDSMQGRGEGTGVLDLQHMVRTSDVDMKVDTAMTIESDGATHAMRMSMQTGIHLEPKGP